MSTSHQCTTRLYHFHARKTLEALTPGVSCMSDSEHILAPQSEGDDKGQKDTDQDDANKAEGRLLEGDRDIDAPEAVDQGRDRQDNGDRR